MARSYTIHDLIDAPPQTDLTDPRWQSDAVLERWRHTNGANRPTYDEAQRLLATYHISLTHQHADRAWDIAVMARLAERWQA